MPSPTPTPTQRTILQWFDALASEHKIIYDSNQTPKPYSSPNSNFHALFIITSAFQSKPSKPSDSSAAEESEDLLPGSDISIAGFEISDVGKKHILAFNKFPSFKPHLLLLTKDGHIRQDTDLTKDDIAALWKVLSSLEGSNDEDQHQEQEFVGIFNCGKEGGCSRVHKHMQIFPLPSASTRDKWTLFPTYEQDPAQKSKVPFKYFVHRFNGEFRPQSLQTLFPSYSQKSPYSPGPELTPTGLYRPQSGDSADEAFAAYTTFLRKTRAILGIGAGEYCPHNVVMTREWIVVIPRRKGQVQGLGVNAASMMGLMTVKDEEEYERWKEVGVERVLGEAGMRVEDEE